jgi:hypothetical protein
MRFVRIVSALAFGLAMVAPEAHGCPVHDRGAPSAPQDQHPHHPGHQRTTHCTCPQACCPAVVSVPILAGAATWTAAPMPIQVTGIRSTWSVFLPPRKHLLPFALAPPPALA